MTMLRRIYVTAAGLAALPLLFVFRFRTMSTLTKNLFTAAPDVSLSNPEHKEQITFDTVEATPATSEREAAENACRALADVGEWQVLAEMMMEWDQSRAKCAAGYPLATVGQNAVLHHLADNKVKGHACHPEPIAILTKDTVYQIETYAANHPHLYSLFALATQMRCHQGWIARSSDFSRYVPETDWFGMSEQFSKVAALLDKYDPVKMNSPLMAAARHSLLGFMPNAKQHVQPFYEEWSNLDLADQDPHQKHAIMMLPQWFGTEETLDVEAQKAAIRTASATGDAAYFSMYQSVFEVAGANLLNLDAKILRQGAHDLVTLRNEDPAFVAELLQQILWWTATGTDQAFSAKERIQWSVLAADIDEIRKDLSTTRLKAIYPEAWENGISGALDLLSRGIQKDIKAGANFTLGETGLEVLPAHAEDMRRAA